MCWHARGLTCAVQGHNRIGDEGAKFIGEALKVNKSVHTLYLVSYSCAQFLPPSLRIALVLKG